MSSTRSISLTLDAVTSNPILFAAGFLLVIVNGISVFGNFIPILGLLIGLLVFFVEPFLAGGILGMAGEALGGSTSFETFVDAGKENYATLLGARLLSVIASIAFALVVALVLFVFVMALGFGAEMGGPGNPAGLEAMGLVGSLALIGVPILALVVYLVVGFFVQFHPAAIVIQDAGLVESFKRSAELVRNDPVSALGYSVIVAVINGVVLVILFAYLFFAMGFAGLASAGGPESVATGLGTMTLLSAALVYAVLQTIVAPVLKTYHVAFYGLMVTGD